MPRRNITIDTITKIEGNAGLKVIIEDEAVKNLQFIIADYRRFFTTAVRGKRVVAVPSFLSRICGTCSIAHLFASLIGTCTVARKRCAWTRSASCGLTTLACRAQPTSSG